MKTLHEAVAYGDAETVRRLLATPGIDVNASFIVGKTPLHMAVEHGRTEVVRLLLSVPGINVNAADSDGNFLWNLFTQGLYA